MACYCYACLQEVPESISVCMHCGTAIPYVPSDSRDIKPGTILKDRYLIGKRIGGGGFGITYKALDMTMNTIMCVKEYYIRNACHRSPDNMIDVIPEVDSEEDFEKYKDSFIKEGLNLAKLSNLPNIVRCTEIIKENNTATPTPTPSGLRDNFDDRYTIFRGDVYSAPLSFENVKYVPVINVWNNNVLSTSVDDEYSESDWLVYNNCRCALCGYAYK